MDDGDDTMTSRLLHELTNALLAGRTGIGIGLVCGEGGEPEYDKLQWESDEWPKPTAEEFAECVTAARAMGYRQQRAEAYPPLADQLDTLFHKGYEGWRSQIQAVKDQFPKPA